MIYNPMVAAPTAGVDPETTRARIISINALDAKMKVAPRDLGVHAMIIRMGGCDGPNFTYYKDQGWSARQTAAAVDRVSVTGRYNMDPAYFRFHEIELVTVEGWDEFANPFIHDILDQWHIGPWTPDSLAIFNPTDWREMGAIMIAQTSNTYRSEDVGDIWFTAVIACMLEKLHKLMLNRRIPSVPIIFHCDPTHLQKYQGQLATYLGNVERQKWLWLSFKQWTLYPGYTLMPNLNECWQWAGVNITPTFAYKYCPDGYENRVAFLEWTGDRMYVPEIMDSSLTSRPANLFVFQDTPAILRQFLQAAPVIPPLPTPSPSPSIEIPPDFQQQLDAFKIELDKAGTLLVQIANQQYKISQILRKAAEDFLQNLPQ